MLQVIWVSWFRFAFYDSPLTPAIRQLNRYCCCCCCCVLSPVYQSSYCNIISWVFSHVSLSAPRMCAAAKTIAIKAVQHIGNLSLDRSVRAVSMLMLSQSHCQASSFVKCIRKWSQANINRILYATLAWKSLESPEQASFECVLLCLIVECRVLYSNRIYCKTCRFYSLHANRSINNSETVREQFSAQPVVYLI